MYKEKELSPKYSIFLDGYKFYFSHILQYKERLQVVMYCKDKYDLLTRVLYKSFSDGTWRVSPGAKDKWYSKGKGIHYTQETKIDIRLLKFLEEKESIGVKNINFDCIIKYFQYSENNYSNTYNEEVYKYNDKKFLGPFQIQSAGKNFENLSTEQYINQIPWRHKEYQSFFPNLKLPSIEGYYLNNTLLGTINYEKFPAILHNKKINWIFASDKNGRTWIDRIVFDNSEYTINTYGSQKMIIDTGFLTTKPLEYKFQCEGMKENIDYIRFNETYNDITPLISQFPIIQEYKSRHLKNKIKSECNSNYVNGKEEWLESLKKL